MKGDGLSFGLDHLQQLCPLAIASNQVVMNPIMPILVVSRHTVEWSDRFGDLAINLPIIVVHGKRGTGGVLWS